MLTKQHWAAQPFLSINCNTCDHVLQKYNNQLRRANTRNADLSATQL